MKFDGRKINLKHDTDNTHVCPYRCGVSSALTLGDVRRAGGGDPPALCVLVVVGAGVQRAGRG